MSSAVLTYISGNSPVHRADARAKILLLLVFSITIFFVRTWWGMAAFALAVCAIAVLARIPCGRIARMLVPVFVLAAFTFAFHLVGDPSFGGASAGAFFAVRMVVLVAASFVVCLTTTTSELLDAFRSLIAPLARLGFPADDAAFTLALSIRFIPVIEREFQLIRAAQISRGAESVRSPVRQAQILACAFESLFIGLFRHADTLAHAMDARCYGAVPERTTLPKTQGKRN